MTAPSGQTVFRAQGFWTRIFSDEKLLMALLARIVSASMLGQMVVSGPLWGLGPRDFPKWPPFEILPLDFPDAVSFGLFAAAAAALLATTVLPVRFFRWTMGGLLVLLPVLVLEDVNRLQPWVYQDFLLFGLFFLFFAEKNWSAAPGNSLQPIRWLMVFTYLWSGLHKLNGHFRENVFEWLTGIFPATEPLGQSYTWALGLGIAEALFALGLLLPFVWPRRGALVGILAMHLLILALLVRDNWNHVVWPWNLQMMAMAVLLFGPRGGSARFRWRHAPQWVVTTLLGALPALYLLEKLPPAFSLCMYSGTNVEALWYWEDGDMPRNCLSRTAQRVARPDQKILYLDEWSSAALRVPVYAGPELYKRFSKDFCACAKDRMTRGLEITWFPRWAEKRSVRIPCSELAGGAPDQHIR